MEDSCPICQGIDVLHTGFTIVWQTLINRRKETQLQIGLIYYVHQLVANFVCLFGAGQVVYSGFIYMYLYFTDKN